MCSLFGLIDFKECLSTHTKNKILTTSAPFLLMTFMAGSSPLL